MAHYNWNKDTLTRQGTGSGCPDVGLQVGNGNGTDFLFIPPHQSPVTFSSDTRHEAKRPPLSGLNDLQLRFLSPDDLPEVKLLCKDWFPIEYPEAWYQDITSDPRFYSLAAVHNGRIISLVVADIKDYTRLNQEDRGILSTPLSGTVQVGYVLSLGVVKEHRRLGVASLLLDALLSDLTTPERYSCKAVFLHVLASNIPAIRFYEQRNFRMHNFLPYYYNINGKSRDGLTYVLYINGGHPPWGVLDYLKHWIMLIPQTNPCSASRWLWSRMQAGIRWFVPAVRRLAHFS